jgi:hypothetical protein
MTTGLARQRPLPLLALALALALAATVLALPTIAQGRKSAKSNSSCSSAAHSRSKSAKSAKSACSRKAHARKRTVKRATKARPRRAAVRRAGSRTGSFAGGGAMVPATCDDGSGALAAGPGAVSCGDGSEASCEDGSSPVRSSAITALVCPAPSGPDPGASEEPEVCEEDPGVPCSDESEEVTED